MKQKRGISKNIKIIILISSILLIGIILLLISKQFNSQNNIKNIIDESKKNSNSVGSEITSSNENISENNQNVNENPSDVGGGGGSSGGSASESSGGGYNCDLVQISYSIANINRTSFCNYYNGSVCEDKTIDCKADIKTKESQVIGNFEIELYFLEEGGNKDTDKFGSQTKTFYVDSSNSYHFTGSANTISIGVNGTANKKINCFYKTIQVPKKCIN